MKILRNNFCYLNYPKKKWVKARKLPRRKSRCGFCRFHLWNFSEVLMGSNSQFLGLCYVWRIRCWTVRRVLLTCYQLPSQGKNEVFKIENLIGARRIEMCAWEIVSGAGSWESILLTRSIIFFLSLATALSGGEECGWSLNKKRGEKWTKMSTALNGMHSIQWYRRHMKRENCLIFRIFIKCDARGTTYTDESLKEWRFTPDR